MGLLQSSHEELSCPQKADSSSKSPELSDLQIEMIRSSWEKVIPNKKHHGELLFYKVFEIAPYLKDLFPFGSDISSPKFTEHALNVMNAVDLAVQNLDNPDVLIPQLQELGRAHAMFELTDKEFGYVGQALLSVLEEGLGDAFTPQLKAAWGDAYSIISDVMMEAINDCNANKR